MLKIITFIIGLVSLINCAPTWAAENDNDIFLLTLPLSGPLEKIGRYALQGAELAFQTWGGGYKLQIADEAGDPRRDIDPAKILVAIGYFTESRFAEDAPRYLYLKKPVLLPFLTTGDAASRGPSNFFRLMPDYDDQGRFMAMEILTMKKRPKRILVITGEGAQAASLTAALLATLADPPQPEAPPAVKGKKPKAPPPIKPMDIDASVLSIGLPEALTPDGVPELTKAAPDMIILSLSIKEAVSLAPVLAESNFAKTPIWGGTIMGFREVGAAFATLKLNLNLCLPVGNPVDKKNKSIQTFINQYLDAYQAHPTWISALGYDSMALAIRAASGAGSQMAIVDFLSDENHHALGTYNLSPGGGGTAPLAFMPVNQETLGFLP